VTLWVFLGQVLSADHSCRAAVARLIAALAFRLAGSSRLARSVLEDDHRRSHGRMPINQI
jgi:hypothetical protein